MKLIKQNQFRPEKVANQASSFENTPQVLQTLRRRRKFPRSRAKKGNKIYLSSHAVLTFFVSSAKPTRANEKLLSNGKMLRKVMRNCLEFGCRSEGKKSIDWEFRLQQKRLRPPAHLHELSLCNFSTRQSQLHESFFCCFLIDMRGAPFNKGNFLAPCGLRVNFFLVFLPRKARDWCGIVKTTSRSMIGIFAVLYQNSKATVSGLCR